MPRKSPLPEAAVQGAAVGARYEWVALSNTTIGTLTATINSSIVVISLPAIIFFV